MVKKKKKKKKKKKTRRKVTQSEKVRGPARVGRDIPTHANALKSTKPGLACHPWSAQVSLTVSDLLGD
jgi:hypothetical protein